MQPCRSSPCTSAFPGRCTSALGLALIGCVAAASAAAAPAADTDELASTAADQPALSPTTITVRNRLQTTLYGFRIRTGYRRWAELGDLPAGESRFEVACPVGAALGTFEFRRQPQAADPDYVIGAYRRSADQPVLIDISAQPGSVGGQAWHEEQGSFMLEPAMPRADGVSRLAQDPRLPLMAVPASLAEVSEFMFCASVGPVLTSLLCRSSSLNYSAVGFGLAIGLAPGYFWSELTPQALSDQFPVAIYTFQPVIGAYVKFLGQATPTSTSHMEKVGQFVGLGPNVGVAMNWGGFLSNSSPHDLTPGGSYRKSCSDIAYDPDTQELSAQCADSSGTRVHSTLTAAACFDGDVTNDGGTLRCELPAGSYQQSCGPIRYRDGVLQALCTRADGNTQVRARLDVINACEPDSDVSNIDGQLRCDRPWVPSGPYRSSCRDIRYDGAVVQADCGRLDTLSPGLRLAYARECKPHSDVAFSPNYARPGRLYCVEPQ